MANTISNLFPSETAVSAVQLHRMQTVGEKECSLSDLTSFFLGEIRKKPKLPK